MSAQPSAGGFLKPSDLKQMTVEELLKQDVVSVSRRPEALGKVAANVFYISGEGSRVTGATTLPELLRMAPTLFVAQNSASEWGINARGFMRENAASNKLLVLIDGRTAYLPLYSNVFWDTTDVFIPDLDSIEVISGPAGSTWGSNAVNGVINIRSRSAHDTLGGLVLASGGTNGSQVAVRQGFALGATGAMRIYAKHTERESTFDSAGANDQHDEWRASQAGFRADWVGATGDEWMTEGEWSTGHYDGRPLAPVLSDAGHLLARWSRELSADSNLWVRAFYDYVLRDTNSNLTEETGTADIEFQHTLALGGRQQFLWGLNYRRIHDVAKDGVGFAILPRDAKLDLGAVFAQHDVTWREDHLRLTSGLRFEHNDFTGWEYQPTLRLAWLEGKHTAWIAASRATRTPSRIEKGFFAPAEPPYFIEGGPDFVSEVIHSYEAGWRGQIARGASITATVYNHRYDNLRSVELGPPIVQANGVRGESYGLELFLDYDVNPAWRLRLGGFAMHQRTWDKPTSVNLEGAKGEASFPKNQLFLRSTFRLNPRTDLWFSLRHIAEVPAFESGNGIVPAYTELDAQLRWQVRPTLQLALVGRSLLDRSHPEIGGEIGRREVPRSVSGSVRWDY
ncbi:MAG TPA: TonB-dependent receptor [Lacunisphaera sp.]|nr:TonB-dependent receptor [Lacunisphaera sp.]